MRYLDLSSVNELTIRTFIDITNIYIIVNLEKLRSRYTKALSNKGYYSLVKVDR